MAVHSMPDDSRPHEPSACGGKNWKIKHHSQWRALKARHAWGISNLTRGEERIFLPEQKPTATRLDKIMEKKRKKYFLYDFNSANLHWWHNQVLMRSLILMQKMHVDGTNTVPPKIILPPSQHLRSDYLVFVCSRVWCCFTATCTCTETVRTVRDGEPRMTTSTFTQLLCSGSNIISVFTFKLQIPMSTFLLRRPTSQ